MNYKITIYAISLGKFQVYRVTWVLVVQVFVYLCILFEENTSPDHATTGGKAREKIQQSYYLFYSAKFAKKKRLCPVA